MYVKYGGFMFCKHIQQLFWMEQDVPAEIIHDTYLVKLKVLVY